MGQDRAMMEGATPLLAAALQGHTEVTSPVNTAKLSMIAVEARVARAQHDNEGDVVTACLLRQ